MVPKEPQKTLDKKEALQLLAAYCSREERCEFDVLQKMQTLQLPEILYNELLTYLREQKYVSNERYTRAFINDKIKFNKWGKNKIVFSLSQKKIPSGIIQEIIQEFDDQEYANLIESELRKKDTSTKANSDYEKKAKLYRFGISRGFESDLILNILSKMGY